MFSQLKKGVLVIIGFISLGLGCIGVILPILPTTPFLLLASFCFLKSSDRLNAWFQQTSLYQKHLSDFVENKAMTLKQKRMILSVVTIMLLFPFFMVDVLIMRITLLLIICIKFWYFTFKIKTI